MHTTKLSISIPKQQFEFIEEFKKNHHLANRSEVIQEAIRLLQQSQLGQYYQEANADINNDFDLLAGEGLDDETW